MAIAAPSTAIASADRNERPRVCDVFLPDGPSVFMIRKASHSGESRERLRSLTYVLLCSGSTPLSLSCSVAHRIRSPFIADGGSRMQPDDELTLDARVARLERGLAAVSARLDAILSNDTVPADPIPPGRQARRGGAVGPV